MQCRATLGRRYPSARPRALQIGDHILVWRRLMGKRFCCQHRQPIVGNRTVPALSS